MSLATFPQALAPSAIQALASHDMDEVNALIRRRLASDVHLVNQVAEHIVAAGGKRLRPMLLILTASTFGHQGADVHQLAAVIECIHTATLLHDDVVDQSDLRRGRRTANAVWGNAASVLVGDFLYSRSFQLMVELDLIEVMQVLADTTNAIAEGEVLQLLHIHNPDVTENDYLRVIERKTAILFAAAARLGALIAGAPPNIQQQLHTYGLNLGYAFQIVDDLLDYTADSQTLGKALGADLAEGKATLPLIHAMAHSDAQTRQRLRNIVKQGVLESEGATDEGHDVLANALAAIRVHGSLEYSHACANRYAHAAECALEGLPDNLALAALRGLAHYAIDRDR